ncbi:alpha-hydroxy-acid oxidizing protein [Alteromonas sp. 07-89-2]|uniref:alpha-hydroxy acid oxidase n=2 Tax=Alteromonas TaxID=226 RepID=UPI000286FA69|nr:MULTISPECIES: alpha-hydroxy acid oxidase [Alteromonas]AFT97033.1 FMN-dependent alpha-hydroxy acid dehydrogenase [Alteromonas macleodii str. 'Balearic Sea AD45']MDK2765935.1 alpha-hydroxy-acid oxidizing protein [Alteromonas macleodii]NOH57564.1 alpha-hydroxy-acid oxidizing protein [Alteromonas sp. 07-89-2]
MLKTPLNAIPPTLAALSDYESLARERLTTQSWAYISGGSADELSMKRNREKLDDLCLLPRTLCDVAKGETKTTLLGQQFEHPIISGPVAYQALAHPDGEIATALATQAQGGLWVMSTLASRSFEEIPSQVQSPRWFQLYVQPTRSQTLELIQKAEHFQFSALVITIDAPINGLRNREQRAEFSLPPNVRAVNIDSTSPLVHPGEGKSVVFQGLMAQAPTWDDIAFIQQNTSLPIVLKGILNPLDAQKAAELGVAGIVVSNHGGRALDSVPSPVEMLPIIRQTVGDEMMVLADSGVRRGADVVKLIALGANAVLIGRPLMYGLATAGALGVAHTIRLLRDELEMTMALCGVDAIENINKHCLWPAT